MTSTEGFSQDPAELEYEKREMIVQSVREKLDDDFPIGMEIVRSYNSNNDENLKFHIIGMTWNFRLASKKILSAKKLSTICWT